MGDTIILLDKTAYNGDKVEGLDNPGVENDAPPTKSESNELQTEERQKNSTSVKEETREAEGQKSSTSIEIDRVPKETGEEGQRSSTSIDIHFPIETGEGQKMDSLEDFFKGGEKCDWEDIKKVVTASALCSEADPIDKAFKVHMKLCQIAKTSTEHTNAIEKLADRVEDFAYDLLDQVKSIEEKELLDEAAGRYASLFSEMTAKAIAEGQKKFVSHPFIFKRVEKRWKLGLSEDFQSRLPHRFLLLLIIMVDAILTPVMLPWNAYVASKNQQGTKLTKIQGIYGKYLMTPYVIFLKTQFMQLTFIGLFFRISMIGSSIAPTALSLSSLLDLFLVRSNSIEVQHRRFI